MENKVFKFKFFLQLMCAHAHGGSLQVFSPNTNIKLLLLIHCHFNVCCHTVFPGPCLRAHTGRKGRTSLFLCIEKPPPLVSLPGSHYLVLPAIDNVVVVLFTELLKTPVQQLSHAEYSGSRVFLNIIET